MSRALASILVVEDDPSMLAALSEVLESQGYQVTRACSAEEAVQATGQKQFDLIVTDVRMGREDGLQAIEKARKTQPTVGTLVVSGYASEEETLRAVSLNVGGYLKKPFKMKELLENVNRILEHRNQDRRRLQERSQLRKALWWSWEALIQVLDDSGAVLPPGKLLHLPHLACQMSHLAGSAPWVPETIRLGLAMRAVRHLAALQHANFQEGLKHYSGLVQLVKDGSLPGDPGRIEHQLIEWLKGPDPEQNVPPALQSLYQRACQAPPATSHPTVSRPASQESLLTLAKTLERGGDLPNARKAFEEMLRRPLPALEEVEAYLGMARVAWAEGEPDSAFQCAQRARQASSALGPAVQAKVALEQGVLLRALGSPGAGEAITEAARLFESVDFDAGLAQSRLALALLGEPCESAALDAWLDTLLRPEHQGELSQCAEWLVPGLLEKGLGSALKVRRMVSRCSTELAGHLPQIPESARRRLLDHFHESGNIPADILQVLQDDPDPQIRSRAAQAGSGEEAAAAPLLEIHSFGVFEVYTGQKHVAETGWKTQKVKFLLAYLAAHLAGTEDVIQELFWPESMGGSRKSLNHALSALRAHLRPGAGLEPVLREGNIIRLNPQMPLWHDLAELEAAWQSAQNESNPETRQQAHRRVVTLYRGPYLEGCYLEWALNRRRDLESRVSEAAYQVGLRALEKQRWQEAVEFAARCQALDPNRQDALVLSMRAHIAAGRPAAAVAEYETYSRWLKAEYEAEPTLEVLREFHRARLGIS